MKKIFVYKLDTLGIDKKNENKKNADIKIWKPSIKNIIPPNSSIKYLMFWFRKFIPFVSTVDIISYGIYKNDNPICSLVCVPALKRWSFMKRDDLQIKNMYTHEDYRGKGYANHLLNFVVRKEGNKNRSFWYMTDDKNIPSQKLCNKIGFKYVGEYVRTKNGMLFKRGKII